MTTATRAPSPAPEADLYAPIMIALSKAGHRVFRNHVGLARHEDRTVRHGLVPGSSDLIGWCNDGRFLAIEVKSARWSSSPKWRAGKQAAFIAAVNRAGGRAGTAQSIEEALAIADRPVGSLADVARLPGGLVD